MLALAISLLFTLAGLVGVAVIADSLLGARAAWVRLMREGEVMRAGLALQAAAAEMSLRPKAPASPRRAPATRRPVVPQRARRACVAA